MENPDKPLIIYLDRDYLLNQNFFDWKDLEQKIKSLDSQIEIMPYIIKMNNYLKILMDLVVKEEIKLYKNNLKFLFNLSNEITDINKIFYILNEQNSSFEDFPMVVMKYIIQNKIDLEED